MEEQSDTPRTNASIHVMKFVGCPDFEYVDVIVARDLERALATATRERDEAIALNVEWAKRAATWLATPEAAQRLQGYRDLGQQVAAAQNERDEARADLDTERMRLAACGVIALANTPDSAAKARDMLPQYRSASSDDVARAVDREMLLRAEVERLRSAFVHCHVRGSSGDLCAVCGLDLRDKVHTAATKAKP